MWISWKKYSSYNAFWGSQNDFTLAERAKLGHYPTKLAVGCTSVYKSKSTSLIQPMWLEDA
jgi:hypothetical protein